MGNILFALNHTQDNAFYSVCPNYIQNGWEHKQKTEKEKIIPMIRGELWPYFIIF